AQIKAMKKVAGTLRLELAQYRQMASFAQFATDLDKATKRQLDKGARMMELLKQRQYRPLPVEQQVVVIFAASADEGFLMDVPVDKVSTFEHELIEFIEARHNDIFKDIREKKVLDDAVRKRLVDALTEFKALFASK
ncbi:MAG TPA: F0F1 ATP synthase subunit alpha, partial [Myxococcota bacterium]|nr:F0F1 ATP synthase subunit alpha [Myxococcota bacterium]